MALEYLTVEHLSTKDLIRIFSKVIIHPDVVFQETPCWLWTGNRARYGHGSLKWGSRRHAEPVYRVLYAWLISPIPKGRGNGELDHLCKRPSCCNPLHLELVPHRINLLRGESVIAKQARKTHCVRGHEFTEQNTYYQPSMPNFRQCRICIQIKRAKRTKRDREQLMTIKQSLLLRLLFALKYTGSLLE
jgi:hypothetical protein